MIEGARQLGSARHLPGLAQSKLGDGRVEIDHLQPLPGHAGLGYRFDLHMGDGRPESW